MRVTIVIGRGSAARRVTFAKARFRLSTKNGRARVVAKVSSGHFAGSRPTGSGWP